MALQLRRGTNAQRLAMTPADGELIFVQDWSTAEVPALWIGDGSTVGGIIAATQNLDDINDVNITDITNGDILLYTDGQWINTKNMIGEPDNILYPTYNVSGRSTSTNEVIALGVNKTKNAAAAEGDSVSQVFGLNKDATTTVQAAKINVGIDSNRKGIIKLTGYDLDDNAETHHWTADATGLKIGSAIVAGGGHKFTVNKLGVNTISPSYELDIRTDPTVADTSVGLNLADDANVNQGALLEYNTSTNTTTLYSYNGSSKTGRLWTDISENVILYNNVGIGGITPTVKLDVNGALKVRSGGADITGDITMSSATSNVTFSNSSSLRGIKGTSGSTDNWLFGGGATALDEAYAEIATANEGNEPIYVRQYSGTIGTGTVTHQATLLDANGNTTFPGELNIANLEEITDIGNSGDQEPTLRLVNDEGVFQIKNHSNVIDKVSFYWSNAGGNRLQFSHTDQWFNTGKLGVNTNAPAYTLDVNGDARISGDLIVSGTTTTVNSETVTIADNILLLNSNVTGTPTENAGIEVERGTQTNAIWQWNETYDWWEAAGGSQNIWAAGEIIAGVELATNGRIIFMNNSDTTPSGNYDLTVRRGADADVSVRWNETTDRWQLTNDGTNYYDILDSTYLPSSSLGDFTVNGDLTVVGNDIKSSGGTTAITLTDTNIAVAGDLTVTGEDILAADGRHIKLGDTPAGTVNSSYTSITSTTTKINGSLNVYSSASIGGNLDIGGYLRMDSGDTIKTWNGITTTTALTLTGADVAVAGDLTVNGNDIKSSTATAITLSGSNVAVAGTLTAANIVSYGSLDTNALYVQLNNADVTLTGNAGLTVKRGSGATAQLDWDEAASRWEIQKDNSLTDVAVSSVIIDDRVRHNSFALTTTTTSADQVVIQASPITRTIKATIQVESGGDYQAMEILMMTDGTSANMTQFADMNTNGVLATFSVDYSSGMRLLVTPVNATTTITVATTGM